MKTCRVEFEAPRKHFEITYDTAKSVEDYEFWGEKFSVTEHSVANARATVELPPSWTMVDCSRDAADMASGDKSYGRFIVDIPADSIQADSLDEWLDLLCDKIPCGWDVLDAGCKVRSKYENSNR